MIFHKICAVSKYGAKDILIIVDKTKEHMLNIKTETTEHDDTPPEKP